MCGLFRGVAEGEVSESPLMVALGMECCVNNKSTLWVPLTILRLELVVCLASCAQTAVLAHREI